MTVFLRVLTAVTGLLLAALAWERLVVEKTMGPVAVASLVLLGGMFVVLLVLLRLAQTGRRELVGKILLVVGSTVVSYLAVDLIAGLILIRPLSPPLVPDQYRHHKMVPNSYSSFQQRDFNYVQRVNNLGMRGPDVQIEKPANAYRILMLGDSFTMGKGVEDDQTFSVLLQGALRSRVTACGGHRSVEVLNGGSDSYAPILSYIQLTRDLAPLSPDMIVLNLDVSDLVQEAAYRSQAVFGPDGAPLGVPQVAREQSLTERIRTWTDHHLFLTRALLFYLLERADYQEITVRNVVEQANAIVTAHTLVGDTEPRDKQWRDIFDSISRIKAYADQHGATFLLSVYPWAHQLNDREWVPGRDAFIPRDAKPSDASMNSIRRLSGELGIELLDLYPAFRAYQGGKPLYFQYDMHWTTAGHEVAAKGIEEYLSTRFGAELCR